MSLSRSQVKFIANTGLFDDAIREAIALVEGMSPLLWHLSLRRQRDRSRVVTRRKQRSKW